MPEPALHRFLHGERRYAIDPESCFCFECDQISWDVLEYYPGAAANHVVHRLRDRYDPKEAGEVISELEWLRATKAILKTPGRDELIKRFEVERGLKLLTLQLGAGASDPTRIRDAAVLLLARSGAQQDLRLVIEAAPAGFDAGAAARGCEEALRLGELAGKKLTVAVRIGPLPLREPEPLREHACGAQWEFRSGGPPPRDVLAPLARAGFGNLGRLAKTFSPEQAVSGRIVLTPGSARFAHAVQALEESGFPVIELDLDAAFAAHPEIAPAAVFEELRTTAVYYANRLLEGRYFRLDPIAPLFLRIYQGQPARRADPAGTNELAVDRNGNVYPSRLWLGDAAFRAGSLEQGRVDEALLKRFDDVGAVTTAACMRCWARGLCGGGTAAVHQACSGDYRTPHEPWCDAQRAWLEAAVAAFNLLASRGVPFARIYENLGRARRPSLFQLARAAFRKQIGLRPLEEADAELLTRWENWNEAAYFLCTESGMFMATRYDREMDSLYPREYEHEFLLLRKTGAPMGLLRVRPERLPGTARVWVYLRDPADYADRGARQGLRHLLEEAAKQQALRRITVPAGPREDALAAFLEALDFNREGVEREALYLHGRYHDVRIYGLTLQAS